MQTKAFIVNEETVVRRKNRNEAEKACAARNIRVDAIRAAHPSEDLKAMKELPKLTAEQAEAADAANEK